MWVGGIRTSVTTRSGRCSSAARSRLSASATAATTSHAGRVEQPDQPLAQQHGVLGEHYSHGSSTSIVVGPPSGL